MVDVNPTGKRFSVQHVLEFRLPGAKIVYLYANSDDVRILQQLGPVQPPLQAW